MLAKGWTANISVVGDRGSQALPEYQVVVEDSIATCFVESSPGKIFEVSLLQARHAQHDITAKVFLDGEAKRSVSRVMKKQERATKMLGRRFSPTEVRPFQFRTITTTERDQNSLAPQQEAPSDFGSISIKIYRGEAGVHGSYHLVDRADPSTTFDELSVKKKKTTEVASVSSVPVPTVAASVRHFSYLDHPERPPYFEFKFVYKSRSLLLALGVIKAPKIESSSKPSIPKAKPEPSSSKKKIVDIIEILSSDEESESQQVRDAKAAVEKAKKDAALAEKALKEAKKQHESSKSPTKRLPEIQLTSILKKPKVEKG